MNILFVGDLSWVTPQFAAIFEREKHKLILAGSNPKFPQRAYGGSKILKIEPSDKTFHHLLGAYHFDAVIYLPYREESSINDQASNSAINSVAGLKNVLALGADDPELRFFLISSSEVFALDGRNGEDERIMPETMNGYALQSLEYSCAHFAQTQNLNINIIRVPFIFDEFSTSGMLAPVLHKALHKQQIDLPSKQGAAIQFLHVLDLAEFIVQAIEEPYLKEAQVVHLYPPEDANWFDIAEWVRSAFDGATTTFRPSIRWHTAALSGSNAKKFFDWSAKRLFSQFKDEIISNLVLVEDHKPTIFTRFKAFITSRGNFLKWIELFTGAVFTQVMINLTSTVILFRQLDYRLLFVVIMGTVHGTAFGLFAAVIAIISALYSWSQSGYEWSLLMYNIENWLPFTMYFIAGAVTGYIHDNRENQIEFQKEQASLISEKYKFLYGIFDEVTEIKEHFREQLMGYRDSFGRIYKITTELDTLQEDEVLYRSLNIMEDILDNHSIAIYTIDPAQQFARLQLCSRLYSDKLDKSLDIGKLPTLLPHIENGHVFQNFEFLPDHPSIFVPIQHNGQTMAGIAIWKASLEQYSLYYVNLVNVVSGLVRSALVRAMIFSQANVEKIFIPNTNILRADAFGKVVQVKTEMKNAKIANFEMLHVSDDWRADSTIFEKIKKGIRSVDYVGERADGDLYILLSQADTKNANNVMERLSRLGVTCQFAN